MPVRWFRLTLLTLWTALLLVPWAAPGGDGDGARREASRILELKWLKEEIFALNLIDLLNREPDQAGAILKQAELARPLIEAYRMELSDVYLAQLIAYREFKGEDEADQGFSRRVEGNTIKAHRRESDLRDRMIQRLNALAVPLREVLREGQRSILEDYQPVLFQRQIEEARLREASDWRMDTIGETLLEAHGLPEGRYRKEKDRLARRILNALPGRRSRAGGKPEKKAGRGNSSKGNRDRLIGLETDGEALARILETMDFFRILGADEAKGRLEEIIRTRVLPTRAARMEQEMAAIGRSKFLVLCPTARYLLNPDVMPRLERLEAKGGRSGKRARNKRPSEIK